MSDRGARFSWGAPVALALLLIFLGGHSLRAYNVTWDEALGEFFFGQRYWSFFTTWDWAYLDFASDPYPEGFAPDFSASPGRELPLQFFPVGGTLAAATSELLFRQLGWLDPYDGYHAVNLWLAVVFVFVFHGFLLRSFGPVVAVLAPFLLFLCPRLVFSLMANTKDFPAMILFGITLVVFLFAYRRGSFAGVVGSGVLFGLSVAAKTNGLFVAPVVGLLFLLAPLPPGWRHRGHALLAILGAGVVGVGAFVAAWPPTWEAPLRLLWEYGQSLATRAASVRPESIAPFLPNLVFTTPLPFLALFGVGIWPLAQRLRRREGAALLITLWIAVVAGRYALPGVVNFDGVRHFLELFPPMAVVAALGLAWLLEQARRRSARLLRGALLGAVATLPLASMAWSLASCHPFEIAYWNAGIGGLPGARARDMAQAGDYWGASYRLGLDWLNEHAAPGSALAVPLIEHAVRVVAPERLRPDLTLLALPGAKEREALNRLREEAKQRDVYVMFVPREDWMNGLMRYFLSFAKPVERWDLEGEPILLIYRLAGPSR